MTPERLAEIRAALADYARAYDEAMGGQPNRLPDIGHSIVEATPALLAEVDELSAALDSALRDIRRLWRERDDR